MENDFNGYNELTFIGSGYTSYVYVYIVRATDRVRNVY